MELGRGGDGNKQTDLKRKPHGAFGEGFSHGAFVTRW
jgi:hypothetical protein